MKIKKNKMYHWLFLCAVVLILGGCATKKPPALNDVTTAIDLSKESMVLFTVKVSNSYRTSYQPSINHIAVWTTDKNERKKFVINVNKKYNNDEDLFNEYLISFQLPEGQYQFKGIVAQSGIFPVRGTFTVPLFSPFTLESKEIIYLGHISADLVERTDDSLLRGGLLVPLLDQAVTGAYGGTFIMDISDLYESDISLFQKEYPFLAQFQVENQTLPQWTQPTEQDMK